MILECACGKMYRVRDDAANQPTKCPVCGGALRAAGGSATNLPAVESRAKELEKERDETRVRVARLEKELSEARSSSASSSSSPAAAGESADAGKADRLERELLALRSETERKIKERERELAQAREAADRESAERRKIESRLNGLEDSHARAIEGKQKTIDALDASVATYRTKLDQLQKQQENTELQRLADLNTFENRLRERDSQDRAELDRVAKTQQDGLAALRVELERKIDDKDRQITDQRQVIDREAAERRRLSEVLTRLQETADRMVKEKDAALKGVEAALASFKTKAEALQRRVNDLEQNRRADLDAQAARVRSSQGLRTRLEEAGHSASDLDHNMDGVDALLSQLRDRMRRLKETLAAPAEAEPAAPALSSASFATFAAAPAPEPERPALSQAGFEYAPPPAAAAPEEAAIEDLPEAEPVIEMKGKGKVDAPSEVGIPAVRKSEPEPEPAFAEETEERISVAEATPLPAKPEEPEDAVPLISGPEEDEASPPPPKKETPPQRPRFSWKRK